MAAVPAAAAALGGVLGDVPYVVFGHSMGTLVAFEFAREVRRRGLPAPKLCVFSNFPAPQTPPAERPWRVSAGLSEAEFKDECRAWGVKPVVMTASFWPQFHLPFRADFKIFDQYEYAAEAPLGVPIKVFLSDRDPKVTRGLVEGWRAQTSWPASSTIPSGPAQSCAAKPGKITPQGASVGRPHSSPLMKLANRPRKRPIGATIAIASPTCAIGSRLTRQ